LSARSLCWYWGTWFNRYWYARWSRWKFCCRTRRYRGMFWCVYKNKRV